MQGSVMQQCYFDQCTSAERGWKDQQEKQERRAAFDKADRKKLEFELIKSSTLNGSPGQD